MDDLSLLFLLLICDLLIISSKFLIFSFRFSFYIFKWFFKASSSSPYSRISRSFWHYINDNLLFRLVSTCLRQEKYLPLACTKMRRETPTSTDVMFFDDFTCVGKLLISCSETWNFFSLKNGILSHQCHTSYLRISNNVLLHSHS